MRRCRIQWSIAIFPPSWTLGGMHWFGRLPSEPGICKRLMTGSLQTLRISISTLFTLRTPVSFVLADNSERSCAWYGVTGHAMLCSTFSGSCTVRADLSLRNMNGLSTWCRRLVTTMISSSLNSPVLASSSPVPTCFPNHASNSSELLNMRGSCGSTSEWNLKFQWHVYWIYSDTKHKKCSFGVTKPMHGLSFVH